MKYLLFLLRVCFIYLDIIIYLFFIEREQKLCLLILEGLVIKTKTKQS